MSLAEAAKRAAEQRGRAGEPLFEAFLTQFYAHAAPEDLAGRSAETLYAAALSLWQFAALRAPGTAKLRVYNSAHDAAPRCTVVEIVNDDMPFLVDSVGMALHAEGAVLRLLLHPIVTVARDASGRLLGLRAAAADGPRESLMRLEIAELRDEARRVALAQRLEAALADTRAAVADWPAMRDALAATQAALSQSSVALPEAERRETLDFLAWLDADNFVFLGCRDYRFAAEGSTVASGLGVLRDPQFSLFEGLRRVSALSPEMQSFLRQPRALFVTKAGRRATVHRPARMDAIGVKCFDAAGAVVGLRVFAGLFTSLAYTQPIQAIPFLRGKAARVLARSGFDPRSHDGKALAHIIDTYPRDELYPIDEDELYDIAMGILALQERQRVKLFLRHDRFGRFISCLVYVPRERYSAALREAFAAILTHVFSAALDSFTARIDDAPLARVHYVLRTEGGPFAAADPDAVEAQLVEAARPWSEKLGVALSAAKGEEKGAALVGRYGEAFPPGYCERFAVATAVADIDLIEAVLAGAPLALTLYRLPPADSTQLRLKLCRVGTPCPLAEVLPILEAMGLKAMTEEPFAVAPAGTQAVWLQDFGLIAPFAVPDLDAHHGRFEEAFTEVWTGRMESDGINRLVLAAALDARQVTVLRLYTKVMRQAGSPFSQAYMEDALAHYPALAAALVALFEARFDPARADRAGEETENRAAAIAAALDQVESLDEDRILRAYLGLVAQSLRTNYCQRQPDGTPKPYLSVKLASHAIELLPLPRPLYEIYVYSPRMEGVHLRAGNIARGGIRWSDRKEDFRTEILALMKAQSVKNAVIVPTGSKGGFVVKRMPAAREAQAAEVIECYRSLMRGMLDLTDNIVRGKIVPPQDTVRHDDDDPYLVVAADKGTATFSDIANAIAAEYGYWLGDAYASGGSAGYDHKAMGITARGAWELVKRHFRALGQDVQRTDFTCVGVGDMSGDVFGNGMLRSPHTKLIAAFNHRHIFLDPDPDPAKSFAERQRLFDLPQSSWADYDKALISPGGGVFERSAKSIALAPAIRARLDIAAEHLTPAELIRAILKAPIDLLFFGGIGTFIKATEESHGEVGDRANDGLRIDGREVRAKVVGEGANLGVTQKGRIEYALAGGRIDTDAIDNSAGVDTSDHEVNLKILLNGLVAGGMLTLPGRNALLQDMTEDVAAQVLRDNYLQGLVLSLAEAQGVARLDAEARLIRALDHAGRLDRAVEFLPSDAALAARLRARQPLTRPELSVLLAYVKNTLAEDLLASDFPDDPQLAADLNAYFPAKLVERYRAAIQQHQLRRELIATVAANDLVNRTGITFAADLGVRTGRGPGDVARAYMIVRQCFALDPLWAAIEALDDQIPQPVQLDLLKAVQTLVERATAWFLRGGQLDIAAQIVAYHPGIDALAGALDEVLPEARQAAMQRRAEELAGQGVPERLARQIALLDALSAAPDIVRLAVAAQKEVREAGARYFAIGTRFGFDMLRAAAARLESNTEWQALAAAALIDDLDAQQAALTAHDLAAGNALAAWRDAHRGEVERLDQLVREIEAAAQPDLAMLTVASRALRGFLID